MFSDEAHRCYQSKLLEAGDDADREDEARNREARVWFRGLCDLRRRAASPARPGSAWPGPAGPSVWPGAAGYLTSSPVTARPMIIRWISEVPSNSVKILASRCQRSTG